MPVTLAQAALNAQSDIDTMVVDDFRKSSFLLDALTFDDVVSPAGGGSTLTYGYNRLVTQPTAGFRAINAEYTPQEVTKTQVTVNLKPLGGAFQIDRVLAGIARGAEVALQMGQKIKAARTLFHEAAIVGDSAVDPNSFDGLDKALAGTSTEVNPDAVTDWTGIDTKAEAIAQMAVIDDWLNLVEGEGPVVIFGNRKALTKFKVIALWGDFFERSEDAFGRVFGQYGGRPLVDLRSKAGSSDPIIPVETRTVATVSTTGLTDLYAVRLGLDGFHGVSVTGQPIVQTWLPDFERAGAVKTGEVEMGPVAVALKSTTAAAVLRNIKVQ
ncbi:MAG TPA: hypothetical protein VGB14_13440 [Acidimicrobiales bacterium]|jgi:hypothetical protein